MDATMAHLPVDVLHVFAGEASTMRVKLCSLVPMANASGIRDCRRSVPGEIPFLVADWETLHRRFLGGPPHVTRRC